MNDTIVAYPPALDAFLTDVRAMERTELQTLSGPFQEYFQLPMQARQQFIDTNPPLKAFLSAVHGIDFRNQAHLGVLQPFFDELNQRAGLQLTRAQIFEMVYERNLWGSQESLSGSGSQLASTLAVREGLPALLAKYQIRSIIDAPCGDFYWMKEIGIDRLLDQYYGVDIVAPMISKLQETFGSDKINFLSLDLVTQAPPRADLIFCRHLLIHLTLADCEAVLSNFRGSGSRYLLITTTPSVTTNEESYYTGTYRPVNLELPPFSLGEPIDALNDFQNPGDPTKLALYDLQHLNQV
jgi:hypothetical protein